jgi:monooxygenase
LKADLTSQYVCRLINYMDKHSYTHCRPQVRGAIKEEPLIDFTSGYVQRSLEMLPRQGSRKPWKLYQNYVLDLVTLRWGSLRDSMHFTMESRSAN